MSTALRLSNKEARWLWLSTNGLGTAPTGALDVMKTIRQLGFVQLDTIQVVSRAHHHILWSRNNNYRETMLNPLLARDRLIFEHFTHDASVIPMDFLPVWQRQFRRMEEKIRRSGWFSGMSDATDRERIKDRIQTEGALSTHAFDTKVTNPGQMWARPPHKKALDYMWFSGELATCFRKDFIKFYNLPERVFPTHLRERDISDSDQLNWLGKAALDRIGFGSAGEIQRFWEASSAKETKTWLNTADVVPIEVTSADGTVSPAFATPDIKTRLAALTPPTSRLRILNPFDPATRDRQRLQRLFGFDYRIEMFVPAAKRKWGYYVYPLLEGDRFVGRIEVKAHRARGQLTVLNFWPEPGVKWPTARHAKLDAELDRLGRFVACPDIAWQCARSQ